MLRGLSPLSILSRALAIVLLIVATGGTYYFTTTLQETRSELGASSTRASALADDLARAREENSALSEKLASEIESNLDLTARLTEANGSVKILTKLTTTDKELLQKYSRVYFLNENYVPSALSEVDPLYQLEPTRHVMIHRKVRRFLERMLEDAADANAPLLVLSGYRSFAEQKTLKSSYNVIYGTGANRFSADQGYSEHQLGTAVDLTTKAISGTSLAFANSAGGKWLDEHAYEYGFILSYPKANVYYQYEPWHWRFVGVALATALHEQQKHFYDVPQREIDEYLVQLFD